jgi:hypothetical protein
MARRTSGRLRGALPAAIAWAGLVASAFAAGAETFSARLAPVPIDSRTRAQITGVGSATAVLDGARLKISGSFSGLQTPASTARLHEGRATGVRGREIAALTVPGMISGAFESAVTLDAQQQQSLRDGKLYIQIHSEGAPEGNLWGWLLQ